MRENPQFQAKGISAGSDVMARGKVVTSGGDFVGRDKLQSMPITATVLFGADFI